MSDRPTPLEGFSLLYDIVEGNLVVSIEVQGLKAEMSVPLARQDQRLAMLDMLDAVYMQLAEIEYPYGGGEGSQ